MANGWTRSGRKSLIPHHLLLILLGASNWPPLSVNALVYNSKVIECGPCKCPKQDNPICVNENDSTRKFVTYNSPCEFVCTANCNEAVLKFLHCGKCDNRPLKKRGEKFDPSHFKCLQMGHIPGSAPQGPPEGPYPPHPAAGNEPTAGLGGQRRPAPDFRPPSKVMPGHGISTWNKGDVFGKNDRNDNDHGMYRPPQNTGGVWVRDKDVKYRNSKFHKKPGFSSRRNYPGYFYFPRGGSY